jgi:HK97 family phage major capsid protein
MPDDGAGAGKETIVTKHVKIETRSDPINPPEDLTAATQAVEELRTAATAFETRQTEALRTANDRIAALETRLNRPGAGQQEQRTEPSDEVRAFGLYLRRGDAGLTEVERRALTVGNDTSAGFLAPEQYGNEILKGLAEYSPIRNYAKVVQIAGPEIKYPKRLTGTNADWVAEIANRVESTPTYGQVTLTPYELATFVEVSKQLLEDAAYDVEGELREAIGEDFGAKEGAAFVSGDGIGKPKGILVASGIQEVVSGHASTLGSAPGDLLIDLMAKLPTAYANNGAWLMNRLTLASVRKLKDSQGAYLWQPGIQAGQPSTLLSRPVIEAVDMDSVAAGKFPIVFGDWSGYRIVDRVGLSILTDPFTRAKNGITIFHARKRVGGDVTHADKFVKLKIAAS